MTEAGWDHSPKGGLRMAQEEWSDFATGPDTQQPEMVSKEAVIKLLISASRLQSDAPKVVYRGDMTNFINNIIKKVRAL